LTNYIVGVILDSQIWSTIIFHKSKKGGPKMKKSICLLLAAIMLLAFATGCSTSDSETTSSPTPGSTASTDSDPGDQDASENEDNE